jgi:hypothetical protein
MRKSHSKLPIKRAFLSIGHYRQSHGGLLKVLKRDFCPDGRFFAPITLLL